MKYYKINAIISILILIIAGFCFYIYQKPSSALLILEYHKVNDIDNDEYTIPVKDFTAQLDYLAAEGYTTISLMDFIHAKKYGEKLPAKPIILTFDDGYEDNFTNVTPIVNKHHMKATFFIISNYINKNDYINWAQLKQLQNDNIEIGCHTANHLPLTTLSAAQIQNEVKLSKLLMEWNGLKTIFFFSYPNGMYNNTAIQALQQNNYLAAVTGDPGLNTFNTNPYLLQRTYIPRERFSLLGLKLRILKSKLFYYFHIKQH